MKLDENSRQVIKKISLMSGIPNRDVEKMWETYLSLVFIDYIQNDISVFPMIGEGKFVFVKDELVKNKGNKANLKLKDFKTNDLFSRIVGNFNDGKETEVEDLLKKSIFSQIDAILNEE